MGHSVEQPVVVFDGDCGFCRLWIDRWRRRTASRVTYEPFQSAEIRARFPQTPIDEFKRAVHLFEPGGRASSGALAVFRLMALGRGPSPAGPSKALGAALVGAYERVPGLARLSETGYTFVASHRPAFMWMTKALWGPSVERPTFALSAWWFRRLLGVVYLVAFWSLGVQVTGLFGHDGILPASDYMNQVRAWAADGHVGLDRFREAPTLFWLSASDAWLRGLCLGGALMAVLLIVGLAPLVMVPLLWLFYLSLDVVGGDFLSFQWDTLLLEAGFLAIFIAPTVIRDRFRTAVDPPRLGVWLLIWLLVRLMIGSGVVKLMSGDPTWRNMTALSFHYETQPIPTPIAWYVHQWPLWFHKVSVAIMLAVEIVVPLLVVGPRRLRHAACVLLVALQALFALTGNFAFFNLLAASLCVLLVDDLLLGRLLPSRFGGVSGAPAPVTCSQVPSTPSSDAPADPVLARGLVHRFQRVLLIVAAVVTLPASVVAFGRSAGIDLAGLPLVGDLAAFVAPFRSVNTYGLFAVMTTTRPEIIIEGSDDGSTWKEYEFKYKAGELARWPPWVAPHQPRVDWQMWFAALGGYSSERWFQLFCRRLLEGSPAVLSLLANDPFASRPPRYLRGVLYRYRFTDPPTRRSTGAWWTRERLGYYSPTLSLGRRRQEDDR
jgi:predicted DCC family thiol-disulfide oxidoreductase YuxK